MKDIKEIILRLLLTLGCLIIIFLIAIILLGEYKMKDFCSSGNGTYFGSENCVKIIDGEAVRYGVSKIEDKYYLYKWASK